MEAKARFGVADGLDPGARRGEPQERIGAGRHELHVLELRRPHGEIRVAELDASHDLVTRC
jgi:hypothetical protein